MAQQTAQQAPMSRPDIVEAIKAGGFLTVGAVIELFGLSRSHAYRAIESGRIPSITVEGVIRVPAQWVDRVVQEQLAEYVELEHERQAIETARVREQLAGAA